MPRAAVERRRPRAGRKSSGIRLFSNRTGALRGQLRQLPRRRRRGRPGCLSALAKDAVVNAADATEQIKTVLHGPHAKAIDGKKYDSQMPAFSQLSDDDIAAIVDHERTSWKNAGPVITPAQVKQRR